MEGNGNPNRFSEKLLASNSRLQEIRSNLHRLEKLLHAGPPGDNQNGATPVANDLHSIVHEGHHVIDEIERSVKRLLVSLGADDPNEAACPPPNNGVGYATAGSQPRR